jgi:hypothetical protein
MPNSLLQQPCEAVEAGDTVRSLAKGYVSNTSCVGQYQLLIKKQKEYKERVEALYGS